ncbi:MAG: carbon-nitrogen hydrolase family protein [Pseudomonadota bacterium]|nr:carbon-nitrogen hydrolase family protein [Pseudomonadota bacterium]
MSKAAVIQMASGPNLQANLLAAERLLNQAHDAGATLAVLPENFAYMAKRDADRLAIGEALGEGPCQQMLSRFAARTGMWIVGGTIALTGCRPDRVRAACLVYDGTGRLAARYDKMHLFDVSLPEVAETYRESATFEPGDETVVVDTPIGRLGLAVCYDLRFPELFRRLSAAGAELVALPAAFTAATGRAHWDVLVRARAVENLCYLLASAQGGFHANGRETWGHSMIVDPWGEVLAASRQQDSGIAVAELSLPALRERRQRFPALAHRRLA